MDAGSSVDDEKRFDEMECADGLNVTSEIVREEEEEDLLNSTLEDSIALRAAKALNIGSVKELLSSFSEDQQFHEGKADQNLLVADALIGATCLSMARDLRSAASAVSPNISRSSSRLSATISRSPSRTTTTRDKSVVCMSSTPRAKSFAGEKQTESKRDPDMSKMEQLRRMELLPDEDSLLSDSELKGAFEANQQQTMDILTAAGNLLARREEHGGYGTPSSYASEQEMNLYFNSQDTSESVSLNWSAKSESDGSQESTDTGVESIMTEKADEDLAITDLADRDDKRKLCDGQTHNEKGTLSAAAMRCEQTVADLEFFATSRRGIGEDVEGEFDQESLSPPCTARKVERRLKRRSSSVDEALPWRRTDLDLDARSRLKRMIETASTNMLDKDISDSIVLNFSTLDNSRDVRRAEDNSIKQFDSFQRCLKGLLYGESPRASEQKHQIRDPSLNRSKSMSDCSQLEESVAGLVDFSELSRSISKCTHELLACDVVRKKEEWSRDKSHESERDNCSDYSTNHVSAESDNEAIASDDMNETEKSELILKADSPLPTDQCDNEAVANRDEVSSDVSIQQDLFSAEEKIAPSHKFTENLPASPAGGDKSESTSTLIAGGRERDEEANDDLAKFPVDRPDQSDLTPSSTETQTFKGAHQDHVINSVVNFVNFHSENFNDEDFDEFDLRDSTARDPLHLLDAMNCFVSATEKEPDTTAQDSIITSNLRAEHPCEQNFQHATGPEIIQVERNNPLSGNVNIEATNVLKFEDDTTLKPRACKTSSPLFIITEKEVPLCLAPVAAEPAEDNVVSVESDFSKLEQNNSDMETELDAFAFKTELTHKVTQHIPDMMYKVTQHIPDMTHKKETNLTSCQKFLKVPEPDEPTGIGYFKPSLKKTEENADNAKVVSFAKPLRSYPMIKEDDVNVAVGENPRQKFGSLDEGFEDDRFKQDKFGVDTNLLSTHSQPPNTHSQPPNTHSQPPNTHSQPPNTHSQPPNTHSQPPNTHSQPPNTHSQPPNTAKPLVAKTSVSKKDRSSTTLTKSRIIDRSQNSSKTKRDLATDANKPRCSEQNEFRVTRSATRGAMSWTKLRSSTNVTSLASSTSPISQKNVRIFVTDLKLKHKDLDDKINRILHPSPSPPPPPADRASGTASRQNPFGSRPIMDTTGTSPKQELMLTSTYNLSSEQLPHSKSARFQKSFRAHPAEATTAICPDSRDVISFTPNTPNNVARGFTTDDFVDDTAMKLCEKFLSLSSRDEKLVASQKKKEDEQTSVADVSKVLRSIKRNLDEEKDIADRLKRDIQTSWQRLRSIEDNDSDGDDASKAVMATESEKSRANRVRTLQDVVVLLKKHVEQREHEIDMLGNQLKESKDRIKCLERKVQDRKVDDYRASRPDKDHLLRSRLNNLHAEREELKRKLSAVNRQRDEALKAERRAKADLMMEKEKYIGPLTTSDRSYRSPLTTSDRSHRSTKIEDIKERVDELELLNKSSLSDLDRSERELDALKRENRSLRMSHQQEVVELKSDQTVMREKLDRMTELSAENLLLSSDAADYQKESAELRTEARELRLRCHELSEENRQCKAEIRDLRRYMDLLRANKTGDSRQDLLNKIEYYQMEHDRLLDEVRRLKQRLGEVSPRSPRVRSSSPRPGSRQSYISSSKPGVRFSNSLERGRSPVSDAMAASTASSHAATRLCRDRSLSPSAALNVRDLTMDRYNKHLEGPDSPRSIDTDCTEMLLNPQVNGSAAPPVENGYVGSDFDDDDDDDEIELRFSVLGKERITDSSVSTLGARCGSVERSGASPNRRARSPSSPVGFRSVSPRLTSSQKCIPDTARDRYPTVMKRSLPRRAFAPRNPSDLRLGYSIKFTRPGGKLSRGTVRYIGHLPTRNEMFVGVELDGFDGKHSGTYQGTKYFSCPTNKGVFTPFSKIIMAWE